MANSLQYPWHIYADIQNKSSHYSRLNSKTWGLDKGLEHILTAVETKSVPSSPGQLLQDVERAIATSEWNERNHMRLMRMHYEEADKSAADTEEQFIAAIMLKNIKDQADPDDWALLHAIASGNTYNEAASLLGSSPGSLRTRMSRLRSTLLDS